MSRDDSGFAGNEFDSYMGAPPGRAGAAVHAAAPEAAPVAPPPAKGAAAAGSKKKRIYAILGIGVIACLGVVAFMKPKEAQPASAEVAAIMAQAQSVDAAKSAMNAPTPAPAGAVMLAGQQAAPTQPAAATPPPAATPVHAAAAELQVATAAAVKETHAAPAQAAAPAPATPAAVAQPAVVAPAPAKVAAAPVEAAAAPKQVAAVEEPGADEALIKKLRSDIAAERAARLRAEKRAEAMRGATVAAVLSDGVVVRDAKGQERVVAVGDKVTP